jgi:hypothetical protein
MIVASDTDISRIRRQLYLLLSRPGPVRIGD